MTAWEDLQGTQKVICCLIQLRGVPEMKMEPLMAPKRQSKQGECEYRKHIEVPLVRQRDCADGNINTHVVLLCGS